MNLKSSSLIAGLLSLIGTLGAQAASPSQQTLPAEFRQDRIYVTPRLADGNTIVFLTDSGGGINAIAKDIVAAQKWPTRETPTDAEPEQSVEFPTFDAVATIPPPANEKTLQGRLIIYNLDEIEPGLDGFLGNRWFADKVLEFDYPRQTLRLLKDWQPTAQQRSHRIALAFKAPPEFNFPRVRVEIDGQPIEMLFDTGATIRLTAASAPEFKLPADTTVGGSFITRTRFAQWQAHHPDWKVIEGGDQLGKSPQALIRVGEVKIAGWTVGPVWFAQRADENFLDHMSQMTDQQIEGAIGGSAFKYFNIVADYPGKAAYFVRR